MMDRTWTFGPFLVSRHTPRLWRRFPRPYRDARRWGITWGSWCFQIGGFLR